MSMQSEGRRQNAECGIGENPDSGIRDKGLGRRGLRLLSRNCEIRRIPESESEVTARREPRPIGRAKLLLSRIQPPAAVATGQLSWADKVGGPVARIFHYRFKFLTVRNLISPSAARTYDYVAVNSLQCGNRGHGPACRHSMERVAAGRERSYRLGVAPTTPHWISCSPVSLPI